MRFAAHVEDGKLAIETPHKWREYLRGFDSNVKLVLDVERFKNRRSISQNSFYWLYLSVIEDETGNLADDLHEFFKQKFLLPKKKVVMGEEINIPASTKELSKFDMSEYMDKICALSGVPIPDVELAGYVSTTGKLEKVDYPKEYKEPKL